MAFKNAVFKEIVKIRELKSKPKLKDILGYAKKQGQKISELSEENRELIISKLKILYDNKGGKMMIQREDKQFTELMRYINRVHKGT